MITGAQRWHSTSGVCK